MTACIDCVSTNIDLAAAQEQGLTTEDISNRLKNLKLFTGQAPAAGDDSKEKEFSDAIMGAMQSLKENLSEAFPAAVRSYNQIKIY